jgi:5'-phosphate synthase pdxT subunit
MKVGILSLQGAFMRHKEKLESLGAETQLVRSPQELELVQAIVLPGGESTTMIKLLHSFGLTEPLEHRIRRGMPVFGTCAGMILLAKELEGSYQYSLGAMDITVKRNAYGRQQESFEAEIPLNLPNAPSTKAIFIRAPQVTKLGSNVEILAQHQGKAVLLRQGPMLACSFHPELGESWDIHRYFLENCIS